MPALINREGIWFLDLGPDENRFSPDWLAETAACLDEVESTSGPTALVTIGAGRFYSNGLDLDWLTEHPHEQSGYLQRVQDLLARVLILPMPTVAALNGHAFGAGAMLAFAHDWRLMREDRGYLCLPEAELGLPFSPGMAALLQSKMTAPAAQRAMLTAHRFPAPEAVAGGLVHEATPLENLAGRALQRAADLRHTRGAALGDIKSVMYQEALGRLQAVD